jgi:hypothetical protein
MTLLVAILAVTAWAGQTGCIPSRDVSMHLNMKFAKTVFPDSYAFVVVGGSCTAIVNRGIVLDEGPSTYTVPLSMYIAGWRWTDLPPGASEPEVVDLSDDGGLIDYPGTLVAFKPDAPGSYTLVLNAKCMDDDETKTKSKEVTFEVVDYDPMIKVTTLLSLDEGSAYEHQISEDPCQNAGLMDVELPEEIPAIISVLGCMFANDGSFLIYTKTYLNGDDFGLSRFRLDEELGELVYHDTWTYRAPYYPSEHSDHFIETDMVRVIAMPGMDIDGDGVLEFVPDNPSYSSTFFENIIDFVEVDEPEEYKNVMSFHRGTFLDKIDHNDDGYDDVIYKIGERVFVLEY